MMLGNLYFQSFCNCIFAFRSNDGKHFNGYIYQKVNPLLETGVELAWSSENNDTKFGLGCKYALDRDTSVRAKVNNSSQIGLGFSQKLRDGEYFAFDVLEYCRNKFLSSKVVFSKSFTRGGALQCKKYEIVLPPVCSSSSQTRCCDL